MQLIKCPFAGCMQPEMWDSTHDIQEHNDKYHPMEDPQPVDRSWRPDSWGDLYVPGSFEQTFADIFNSAFDLLVERQRKYGPENIEALGLWGVFGRLADDKVNRLRRAFNGEVRRGRLDVRLDDEYEDESIDDAIFDIANYALIMYAQKHGLWGAPLEEDLRG